MPVSRDSNKIMCQRPKKSLTRLQDYERISRVQKLQEFRNLKNFSENPDFFQYKNQSQQIIAEMSIKNIKNDDDK